MSGLAGRGRVAADAAAKGLHIEIFPRPAAGSLAEAAELIGVRQQEMVKSLVVKRRAGTFVFALIPGGRVISWPKLRAVVGVNKLQLPAAEVALAATGYERGTITPRGSTTAWPLYVDEAVRGTRITMGAGELGYSMFVQADELIAAFGATVADISVPQ